MPKVTERANLPYPSRSLAPNLQAACLDPASLRKLFFTTTTKSSFISKEIPSNVTSFSDVHQAAQRMKHGNRKHAPFWSREMTRYQQTYIPLPLDGALINRELAKTFHPDEEGSSVSRSTSVPVNQRSRYVDDFGANVEKGVDYRLPIQRPKEQKHVRDDVKLFFTDSVTHEVFPEHVGVRPREPFRPLAEKPPANSPSGFRFRGSTRYAEEFIDLSKDGYRVQLVKGRDDSNRINGNSIPNRLRDFLFENDVKDVMSLPTSLASILSEKVTFQEKRKFQQGLENPYLEEYLHVS